MTTSALGSGEGKRAPQASGGPGEGAALDLAHLLRQCLGDGDLAAELLREFRTVALRTAAELARDGLSFAARADAAHRLKGSALAVGAPAVAHAAGVVEALARAGAPADAGARRPIEMSQAIAALAAAVSQAAAEIARLEGKFLGN